MYTPIIWANPNNLELIKEKRNIERLNNNQKKKTIKSHTHPKENILERLYKSLSLARVFKMSYTT
jgi:hypothetical protein